jgi:hypothetical protein
MGPSKAEALEMCPCYEREPYEQKDDQGETPSERGTRLHLAVETNDLTLCLNDDEKALVQTCLDTVNMLVGTAGEGAVVNREVQVSIPDPNDPEEPLTWGTADWILFYPGGRKAIGLDWKFIRTMSVSAPKNNLQFRSYAIGILCQYPELEEIKFTMVAPEFKLIPDPVVFTREDIVPTQERLGRAKANWLDPFKKPCPSDLCSMCAHAARCPALGKLAVTSARELSLPIPETFAPEAIRTPHERALALVIAGALAQWAEQIKSLSNEFGRNNRDIELPGFKWMSRKGNPKVLKVAEARQRLGLSDPDFLECCRMSITEVAKKYAAVHGIPDKSAREKVDELLGDLITRGAQVEFWQRAKDGDSVLEIVAGVANGEGRTIEAPTA